MPRVTRNYEHTDFSDLLAELQNPEADKPIITEIAPEEPPKPPVQEVPEARRRRSSLMDNREMKYAFSRADGIMHDRDCPLVPNIKDRDFEMLTYYSTEMATCPRCIRKAMIRRGININDTKRINAYLNIFNRFHAKDQALYTLFIENHAKISDVQLDSVIIKVREDRWMIRCNGKDLQLFHNNYAVLDDNHRYFSGGFHLQRDGGIHTFRNFVNIMCHYSWAGHAKSWAAKNLVKRQEKMRKRLTTIKNSMKVRKFSLLYSYYAFVDCNNRSRSISHKHGLLLDIRQTSPIRDPASGYTLVLCRIKRWEKQSFLSVMDALKEYSVAASYFDYADHCIQEIEQ